jgi:hypothetical protein
MCLYQSAESDLECRISSAIGDAASRVATVGPFSTLPLAYNLRMANLSLVYGLRLLPADELGEVGDATIKLKNGREAHVTMHVLEGSKDEIEKQLKTSLEAFFDFYPEI